jgi:polysaccharide biosynthesis-related protein
MFGRFLNWLLTFVYVRVLLTEEFGQMTNLYAWTAILMILLTYGMETAFFRFANKHEQPADVYTTTLWSLGISSLLFVLLGWMFLDPLAASLHVAEHKDLLSCLLIIVSSDAFMAIPLGYLRYEQRPWWFMTVRMSFVFSTIILTLFAFYGVPALSEYVPLLSELQPRAHALQYIFGINLVSNGLQFLLLLPTLRKATGHFDASLLGAMLRYALPMLLLGLAGNFNNQADKILFPLLFDDPHYANGQLGIYGACYKLAVVMVLFTQAFRYAYDPFIFAEKKKGEEAARRAYSSSMTYYVLFTLFIFLAVMSYIDGLKLLIAPAYYPGLTVVPWIMAGQLMFGVYFNLSLWYKVTDRTHWGAILSIVGCALTVLLIVLLAPRYGFMACAWASVVANGGVMLISYTLGQHYYPVSYDLRRLALYTLLTIILYGMQWGIANALPEAPLLRMLFNTLLLLIFLGIVYRYEVPKGTLIALRKKLLHR